MKLTFADYFLKFLLKCVAYSAVVLGFILAGAAHDFVAPKTACVDTAGVPGYWDCELGHRVVPDTFGEIGSGL